MRWRPVDAREKCGIQSEANSTEAGVITGDEGIL